MDINSTIENLIREGLTEKDFNEAFKKAAVKVEEEKKKTEKTDKARTAMIEAFINYCLALGILKKEDLEEDTVKTIDKLLQKEEKSMLKNASFWLDFLN